MVYKMAAVDTDFASNHTFHPTHVILEYNGRFVLLRFYVLFLCYLHAFINFEHCIRLAMVQCILTNRWYVDYIFANTFSFWYYERGCDNWRWPSKCDISLKKYIIDENIKK